ncbi:hypothetical protein [Halomonas saccharevitans]|uniref:RiboL-PSP-HEPN domain-containing protein n=1 Tax=Halomonas saccharevitans TaxID=416872 RepID=A0A1I7CAR7_9GAMM|nr:hypothetical protein [Halomonas saccharevitans]SFT96525.1 hypothetical protein SAMN04487956_13938 [Halomonas saccharevitans]
MTNNTELYVQVSDRIDQLSNHLMPSEFDDFVNYDPCYYDMARGYCLLVHAELENYFERVGLAYLKSKYDRWVSGNGGEDCIIAITMTLAIEGHQSEDGLFSELLSKVRSSGGKGKLKTQLGRYVNEYYRWMLGRVNGIKKEDLKKIFAPAGVFEEIEPYVSSFDRYGELRGGIAHSNVGPGLVQEVNPKYFYDTLYRNIMPDLSSIDAILLRKNPDLNSVDWSRVTIRDTN